MTKTILRAAPLFAIAVISLTIAVSPSVHGAENRSLALCVGINGYSRMGQLRYCAQDAQTIKRSLEDSGNFRRVKILTDVTPDGATAPVSLLPTTTNILLNLKQLAALVPEDGSLLFFFSGHGVERNGESFLVPVDGDETVAIPVQQIKDIMADSRARDKLLILDACRSGLGAKGLAGVRGNMEEQALAVLVSCGADQFSYEVEQAGLSLFTLVLDQGLSGDADLDGNGVITGAELHRFLNTGMGDYCLDNDILTTQIPELNFAGQNTAFLRIDQEFREKRERERLEKQLRAREEAERLARLERQREEEEKQARERAAIEAMERRLAETRQREAEAIKRKEEESRRYEERLFMEAVDVSGCDAYLNAFPYGRFADEVRSKKESLHFDITGRWFVTQYAPPHPRTGVYDQGFTYSINISSSGNGVYVWKDVAGSYRPFGGFKLQLGRKEWSFTYVYSNGMLTYTMLHDGRSFTYRNNGGRLELTEPDGSRIILERR